MAAPRRPAGPRRVRVGLVEDAARVPGEGRGRHRGRPEVAARCFADLRTRCWSCGRALRDETSKTLGIGPECRSGMDPAVLARYCTPEVGRAHAEHLAKLRAALPGAAA
ncbi:DUF6011 domain-containing protein [Actinacidiphila sp. DG2A-62]|uniref:DUF6011 domain-containing protein n=1 Tax=Actinacidiphila sp. DG2A-62 TaxID=3108821 RepID=UPI002DBC52D5|nr:DUF6011 domain-containing protein [Actinacidiphila sp. DG2A-62]MEC3995226.1 DUF6011 domain-containing protein [Actinacidiphila sp. DG2A-62]